MMKLLFQLLILATVQAVILSEESNLEKRFGGLDERQNNAVFVVKRSLLPSAGHLDIHRREVKQGETQLEKRYDQSGMRKVKRSVLTPCDPKPGMSCLARRDVNVQVGKQIENTNLIKRSPGGHRGKRGGRRRRRG